MNINDMINELKKVLPEENFKTQPKSALIDIKNFEAKYMIDTKTFLKKGHPVVSEEDAEKWVETFETYLLFKE